MNLKAVVNSCLSIHRCYSSRSVQRCNRSLRSIIQRNLPHRFLCM